MVLELNFQKGSTRLTLSPTVLDSSEERPRLRKILKKLRFALGLSKDEPLNIAVYTPADQWTIGGPYEPADPKPEALTSPDCSTYGELLNFLATFTGSERSVVTSKHTVKELISALNANELSVVSSYIHKIGFGVASKVGAFMEFLSNDPNTLIPAEVQP